MTVRRPFGIVDAGGHISDSVAHVREYINGPYRTWCIRAYLSCFWASESGGWSQAIRAFRSGWIAWTPSGTQEAPALTRLPSEAVRGAQWFFHAESEEALIPAAAEYLGTGKLFWASDWPHWDNEYPESLDEILDRDDLADAQKLLRGRDTALRMYGMG